MILTNALTQDMLNHVLISLLSGTKRRIQDSFALSLQVQDLSIISKELTLKTSAKHSTTCMQKASLQVGRMTARLILKWAPRLNPVISYLLLLGKEAIFWIPDLTRMIKERDIWKRKGKRRGEAERTSTTNRSMQKTTKRLTKSVIYPKGMV
jgi:hypothetical protein